MHGWLPRGSNKAIQPWTLYALLELSFSASYAIDQTRQLIKHSHNKYRRHVEQPLLAGPDDSALKPWTLDVGTFSIQTINLVKIFCKWFSPGM